MKISKLFHWLYALVMFLPILFFIPNVLYYAFNEHAVNESSTEVNIQNKYQSNEVNTLDDLVLGNIYQFHELPMYTEDLTYTFYILSYYRTNFFDLNYEYDEMLSMPLAPVDVKDFYLRVSVDTNNVTIAFPDYSNDIYISYYLDNSDDELYFEDVVFVYNDIVMKSYFIAESITPSYTSWNIIEDVEVITDVEETITQKVYYGWQSVWSLPVFSWTSNTFFSAPFNYISGLFGFQAGNTLSNCLSYWFSISIIWLVFDLMIYVPLLVHRWLDKASLE